MSVFRVTDELRHRLRFYARFPQRSVALRQLVEFGASPSPEVLLRAAQWLREELPVRLARRAIELEDLPQGLSELAPIQRVAENYAQSFEELASLPDCKYYDPRRYLARSAKGAASSAMHDLNRSFVQVIERVKARHDTVPAQIAQGVLQLQKQLAGQGMSPDVHTFLDRFYLSRIGIRFLIGHQIALFYNPPSSDYVGLVCTNTNIGDVVREASQNAQAVCQRYYGMIDCPSVQVVCGPHLTFTYVPSHLHHVLFEIIKNSLRATVEHHGIDGPRYPPVRIIVAEGHEDLTIKVSDEGGGIPRSAVPNIWKYSYSTAKQPPDNTDDARGEYNAPLAGYGYGLPMSRLYARYFGGDLKLISMEGYGTDAYIHLNRLSDGAECLA